MNGMKKLVAVLTSAAAIATLFTVSASAETRHRDETPAASTNLVDHRSNNDGEYQRNGNDQRRAVSRNQTQSYDRGNRSYDRSTQQREQRSYDRGYDRGRSSTQNTYHRDSVRYDNRGRSSFSGQGRVNRF